MAVEALGPLTESPTGARKSMAALIDLAHSGRIEPGSRVLHAHLDGQPALNAYAGAFRAAFRLVRSG